MLYTALKSAIAQINWPPIPNPLAAQRLATLNYLEQSQWLSEDEIKQLQMEQLKSVLHHAKLTVPYYQEQLRTFDFRKFWDYWQQLPILTRADLQINNSAIFSTAPPVEHGENIIGMTSGSTGRPIKVYSNIATQFFWNVLNLRDHLWHNRNFGGVLAIIRSSHDSEATPPYGKKYDNWGEATADLIATGPGFHINPTTTSDEIAWLQSVNPDYLLCFPSTLKAIVKAVRQTNVVFNNLKEIRTISEVVEPELRSMTQDVLGVAIKDVYSAKETGYIALQCPVSGHYHIQSENVFVELLNDQNLPCVVGETGRVVVTTLHNFASPLIRYEIGDFAIKGEPCSCGRGLPVLQQVMGRQRNLIRYPNGQQAWPSLAREGLCFNTLFPIWQYQFTQTALDTLHCKLTCPPCSPEAEALIKERIQFILDYPFTINIDYVDAIERDTSGKYEDFKSLL